VDVSGAMVAEERIEFRERLRDVVGAAAEDHIQVFLRVSVIQPKVAFPEGSRCSTGDGGTG